MVVVTRVAQKKGNSLSVFRLAQDAYRCQNELKRQLPADHRVAQSGAVQLNLLPQVTSQSQGPG